MILKIRVTLIILLLALLVFLPAVSTLYTDILWFQDIGYLSVFLTRFYYKLALFLIGLFVSAAVIVAGFYPLIRDRENLTAIPITRAEKILFLIRNSIRKYYRIFYIVLAAVLSISFAYGLSLNWEQAALYYNSVSSGINVPVYNNDASFFLFKLPFYAIIADWAKSIILTVTALVVFGYFFKSLTYTWNALIQLFYWYRLHVFILASSFFAVESVDLYLKSFERAYSRMGAVTGPGFVDAFYLIPFYRISAVVSLVLFFMLLLTAFRAVRVKPAALVTLSCIVLYLIGAGVIPYLIQYFYVTPDEYNKEKTFISNHIEMTRAAYDLSRFSSYEFVPEESTTPIMHLSKSSIFKNLRLWDSSPLLETYNQLQAIRTYYVFNDIDIDRYTLSGETQQVAIAVRELDKNQIAQRARTWVNLHLKYTHGYGVVVSPVGSFSEEGLPQFYLKNIPVEAVYSELVLKQPQIYFGEKTDDYVIVGTREDEFGYPSGEKNVYERYRGSSGVELDSRLKKLAFSFRFGTPKIAITDAITPKSKILYYRNIYERTRKIAPFLILDTDAYPVLTDGKIYWIIDAYTASGWFPYSEKYGKGGFNYLRNSVKVVIDAYSGSTDFYIVDSDDPIIRSYKKLFKGLFKDVSQMPLNIKSHLRYPVDLFYVQAEMLATYHMSDPQVFYNREDRWAVAEEIYDANRQEVKPYYVMLPFNLNDADYRDNEFILMLPMTPYGKNNLVAWLFVSSDGSNYGRGGVYRFPKGRLVFGPMQIESRVDQDPLISQQITLWSQAGSRVIRGNLLTIPVLGKVFYVEPLYLKSEQSSIPELKRVIVADEKKVVMAESIEKALALLSGDEIEEKDSESDGVRPDAEEFAELRSVLKQMDEALKSGDLKGFAEAYDKLRRRLLYETTQTP